MTVVLYPCQACFLIYANSDLNKAVQLRPGGKQHGMKCKSSDLAFPLRRGIWGQKLCTGRLLHEIWWRLSNSDESAFRQSTTNRNCSSVLPRLQLCWLDAADGEMGTATARRAFRPAGTAFIPMIAENGNWLLSEAVVCGGNTDDNPDIANMWVTTSLNRLSPR